MTYVLWSLVAVQMALGLFDVLYHHEMTERLAWRVSQKRELRLHAARNLVYALLFAVLGLCAPHGVFALAVMALMAGEVGITLVDFVEEDLSRKLPWTERVTHALLALNYGALLAMVLPLLWHWGQMRSGIVPAWYGLPSILMALAAIGVLVFGLRDAFAAARMSRLVPAPAAGLVSALPPHQTVLITGATGFIGTRLVEALIAAGHHAIVQARDPLKAAKLGAPIHIVTALEQIAPDTHIDAIINLAGEAVAGALWTPARIARLIGSRRAMTQSVVQLIGRLRHRPAVLVSASAIGWYGLHDDERLTEASPGSPCVCRDICLVAEQEAREAECLTRVVRLRIGLVLGVEGGMLARLLLPFEFGAGGPIGSGWQWMSWISRDDTVRLIAHAIATPSLADAVNATAPLPVTNRDFARALGRALHRPAFLPLPAWPLRLLGGDFARELLLGGQCVLPQKALASGFVFRHPTLNGALAAMLGTEGIATATSRVTAG